MSEPDGASAQAKSPAAQGPGHMRWDTSQAQIRRCTLATARPTAAQIIVNFGVKSGRDYPGSEVGVELVQQIALSPTTARHLMATLERVIGDHDRAPRRPR